MVIKVKVSSKYQRSNGNSIKNDPFSKPWEPGIFVKQLSKTHNLIFSKFSLIKNHLFIVTDLFESQNGFLTHQDFYPVYLTVKAMKGVALFDSGITDFIVDNNNHRHFQIFKFNEEEFSTNL